MQQQRKRLLALLFAATLLNMLSVFEAVLPTQYFGIDFNTARFRQAAKACLTSALTVSEKVADEKQQYSIRYSGGSASHSIYYIDRLGIQQRLAPEQISFLNQPTSSRKLWLLNRSLLI